MRGRVWAAGAVQMQKVITAYNVLLLGGVSRAVCGLASQLWVPGRADGWGIKKGADWYPCCPGRGTGRGGQDVTYIEW
eukprot:1140282-Pelagomonas_calceolata.AAC.1